MLIVFGGLPGTGKTTISKEVAKRLKAVYLRIDTIEQTLKNKDGFSNVAVGPEGYLISYAIAKENLALGLNVVADCVNPIAITRDDWRQVAEQSAADLLEFELICSDKKEHQRRVEARVADIKAHQLPTWQDVLARDYEPWDTKTATIDTFKLSIEEAVQTIINLSLNGKNLRS